MQIGDGLTLETYGQFAGAASWKSNLGALRKRNIGKWANVKKKKKET